MKKNIAITTVWFDWLPLDIFWKFFFTQQATFVPFHFDMFLQKTLIMVFIENSVQLQKSFA